jgi:hypothetical protein
MKGIESRLEVLERTNITLADKMDELKAEICSVSAQLPVSTKQVSESNESSNVILDPNIQSKLLKVNQDSAMLLEKTENSTLKVQHTLREVCSIKKDLEKWHESVFKGQDSEKINEILNIVSSRPFQPETRTGNAESKIQSTEPVPSLAKSLSETKTNQDIPGLCPNSARSSYRREGFRKTDAVRDLNHKKKRRRSIPKKHSVVLLTDSTMRGFDQKQFPAQYQVDVINKNSVDAVSKNLNDLVQNISRKNPAAIYIHTGTQDIIRNQDPEETANKLVSAIDKMLRETSQNCKIFISHVLSCGTLQPKGVEFKQLLSSMIQALKDDPTRAELWNRVDENANSNFLAHGDEDPYKYLFVKDMVHLNHRRVNVIMGNFRTKLNQEFLRKN